MPSYILQTEFIFLMMLCLMSLFFLSLKPRLTPHYLHHSLYHSILTNLLMLHMHLHFWLTMVQDVALASSYLMIGTLGADEWWHRWSHSCPEHWFAWLYWSPCIREHGGPSTLIRSASHLLHPSWPLLLSLRPSWPPHPSLRTRWQDCLVPPHLQLMRLHLMWRVIVSSPTTTTGNSTV
jgi:hypothetical protein